MTRILLIDNYDSFTHNLAHLVAAVTGELPRVVRNDAIDLAGIAAWNPDAIIVSPGPGHPGRAEDVGICAEVLRNSRVPVLGVCLGHQLLVQVEGGRVDRVNPMHGMRSAIFHDGRGLFDGIPQGFEAVRYHSLAALDALPPTLERTAWTQDGIVMGVRLQDRPCWGVQFHPESICSAQGNKLIANFLRESGLASQPASTASFPSARAPTAPPCRRVLTRSLSGYPDPERVFVALFGEAPMAFWLDSSRAEPGLARFSFMGASLPDAPSLTYDAATRTTIIRQGNKPDRPWEGSVLDVLDSLLDGITAPSVAGLPFAGGFVGYFGYEMKADLGSPNRHASTLPDAQWMLVEHFLAFDHEQRTLVAVGLVSDEAQEADYLDWVDAVARKLDALPPLPSIQPQRVAGPGEVVARIDMTSQDYLGAIDECLEALRAGESYELCLTTRGVLPPLPAPLDFYRILRGINPAPYAAYVRFGETVLLSSSPERFLSATAQGRLSSKPIKGTAAREVDPAADSAARAWLRNSVKNQAENLMIVDLVRSDFSHVCEQGSVTVPKLMEIESYATVHQMVSTIEGWLASGRGILDAVRTCFPGGSMTGAPKLRSMVLLEEMERSARGIYSGSIGYLSADGAADLNIAIRTAVATPQETRFGVGGAIVVLSDPAEEYEEILLKAGGLLRAYAVAVGQDGIRVAGPAPTSQNRPAEADPT